MPISFPQLCNITENQQPWSQEQTRSGAPQQILPLEHGHYLMCLTKLPGKASFAECCSYLTRLKDFLEGKILFPRVFVKNDEQKLFNITATIQANKRLGEIIKDLGSEMFMGSRGCGEVGRELCEGLTCSREFKGACGMPRKCLRQPQSFFSGWTWGPLQAED